MGPGGGNGRPVGPRDRAALVAVIGPSAHDLVAPFVAHYTGLGVTEFRIAVHIPPHTPGPDIDRLLDELKRTTGPPDLISEGPWRVSTNPELHKRLRARATADWHVLADADEFQYHPHGIGATVDRCFSDGVPFAGGLMVDRLPADGKLGADVRRPDELDRAFPVGCFITAHRLKADPRKIMLAHREVEIGGGGNHFVVAYSGPDPAPPMPVHHFKWRARVRDYLEHRARSFEGSSLSSERGVRQEALRALDWLANGIGLTDETFPVTLRELPERWNELVQALWPHLAVKGWNGGRSSRVL